MTNNFNVVISLSGGMDSTTLLLQCLFKYNKVYAVSFNYGQKHKIELERVKQNIEYLKSQNFLIEHTEIDLSILGKLFTSALTSDNIKIPEGHYAEENMKATVVPNRNAIFSSIIYGYALSLAKKNNSIMDIALGIHAGDHCFSKYTNILTPNGLKTINTLKENDLIYSYNLEKNIWEIDILQKIWEKNIVDKINIIQTYSGKLELTDEHEVYVLKLKNFHNIYDCKKEIVKKKVKDLIIGDKLYSVSYNLKRKIDNKLGIKQVEISLGETRFSKIISIVSQNYNDHVYDLSIEKNHNFFAGEFGQFLISNSIYPDCRQEFRDAIYHAFKIGNWDSDKVNFFTPFLKINKIEILKEGLWLCKQLHLDFDTIYKNTNTCYNPDKLGRSCGKCGSCQERLIAFFNNNKTDPVKYSSQYSILIEAAVINEQTFKLKKTTPTIPLCINKIIIGIDIDGVIRNFVPQFNKQFRIDFPKYAQTTTNIEYWNWYYKYPWEEILIDKGFKKEIITEEFVKHYADNWYAYRQPDIIYNAPVISKVVKILESLIKIYKDKIEFKIITCQRDITAFITSMEWLKKNKILTKLTPNVVGVKEWKDKWDECDIMIDDSPDVLKSRPKEKISIKFGYKYNLDCVANYEIDAEHFDKLEFIKIIQDAIKKILIKNK